MFESIFTKYIEAHAKDWLVAGIKTTGEIFCEGSFLSFNRVTKCCSPQKWMIQNVMEKSHNLLHLPLSLGLLLVDMTASGHVKLCCGYRNNCWCCEEREDAGVSYQCQSSKTFYLFRGYGKNKTLGRCWGAAPTTPFWSGKLCLPQSIMSQMVWKVELAFNATHHDIPFSQTDTT